MLKMETPQDSQYLYPHMGSCGQLVYDTRAPFFHLEYNAAHGPGHPHGSAHGRVQSSQMFLLSCEHGFTVSRGRGVIHMC